MLKILIIFHQIVPLAIWELCVFTLSYLTAICESNFKVFVVRPVTYRELTTPRSCNETPRKTNPLFFLRNECFAEETDMDNWNTRTHTRSGSGSGVCYGCCYHQPRGHVAQKGTWGNKNLLMRRQPRTTCNTLNYIMVKLYMCSQVGLGGGGVTVRYSDGTERDGNDSS